MGPNTRVVAAYLDDASADLDMVAAALERANRHGAYHLHQAAEKLTKAVRVHRGLVASKEHRIGLLVEGVSSGEPKALPSDDPWRERLLPLDALSQYATAYRYPTMSGALKPPPDPATTRDWMTRLTDLIAVARRELFQ